MMITFQQPSKWKWQKMLSFLLLLMISAMSLNAQISGTVFRDFNANGVKDNSGTFNETGIAGVTVSAYNSSGSLVTSATTASNGTYSLTGLTFPVRIEFTGYSNYDFSGPTGSGNKSSVQFYSAGSSAANFGINYSQHYTSTTNPYYIVSQFEANRPPSSEALATAMLKQQYSTRGNSSFAPSIAKTSEIGSTWAVAYDRKNSLIYAATFAKRHASMKDNDADGKEDLGAIYSMTSSGSAALWKDLSTLGIDFGTSLLPTIATRALPTTITGPSHDAAMFALVGKIGIGGITLSDDYTKMYVMNLYDKKIYTIDIASKTLIGTSAVVPSSCSSGNNRPFALKYHRGKVYVGSICDATTSGNFNDLKATVYSYDGTSFTSVLTYPLNYVKGYVFKDLDDNNFNGLQEEWGKQWNAWSDVMPSSVFTSNLTSPASQVILNPQPMLVDLEFDVDESLIMVFNDRFGHQAGQVNYGTNTSNTSNFYTGLSAGDILRASYSSGTYTIENAGVVGGLTGNTTNSNGPSGGEFYYGDHDLYNYHAENVIGGSLIFPGKGEVATVVTDPIGYWAGGVYFFDNTNGNVVNGTDNYQLYTSTLDNTKFGKANGLGDMELITDAAPIEIGNRVWLDTDGDGIQDAGENPISGVSVQLVDGVGTVLATATTDANGNYYFSSASGTSTSSIIYGVALLPNTNYTVRIPNASGGSKQSALGTNVLTTTDAGSNDLIDSDGAMSGNNADIAITTGNYGENNHTYDFGFTTAPACSLSLTTSTSLCSGSPSNKYTLSGQLTFSNAPSTGTLTVSVAGGQSQVFTAPFASPLSYSLSNLYADGVSHNITATFSATPTCTATSSFTAPTSVGSGLVNFPMNSTTTASYNDNPYLFTAADNMHYPLYAPSGQSKELYAFDLDLSAQGVSNYAAYCVEKSQSLNTGSVYTIIPLESLSRVDATNASTQSINIPSGGIGKVRAGMLRYLFDNYYVNSSLTNASWNNTNVAAFAAAVAEITHESYTSNNSFTLKTASVNGYYYVPVSGNVNDNAAINMAETYVQAINTLNWSNDQWMSYQSTNYFVIGLENSTNQDVVVGIPIVCTAACTKPNAGVDQTSCPTGTVTLTGTTPTTGTWAAQTGNPSGASVGSTTSGVATVTFTAATAGIFNFIYTTGSCSDTMSVVVSGSTPSTPTCSPVSVCTGADATASVTAAVSPAGGTITWNTGNATTATSYTYTVTSSCGSANCTNTITRTSSPSTPTCSPVTLCVGTDATASVTAAVSPAGGTITWNTGNATTATSYTYTVTSSCGSANCTNTITRVQGSIGNYVWSDLNNNGLNDEVASAGINGVTVELWDATTNTLLATTTTANNGGNPGYYNFNICADGDYKVKFPTTVGGNGLTTQTSTASTDNNSDANTSTGFSPTFTMTLTGTGTQVNNPTIDAGYQSCVKPNAGSNQTACGGNCVTLTGTNLTTGTWTAQTGNPAGATLGVTTTGVASVCFSDASAGTYNFIYTVGTCTDTMNVTVTAKPNAGIDATICAGNCMNITGTANTGTWTAQTGNPAGATLGATTTGVANVCFTNASVGTYSFIYTINGCTDTMNVTVTAKPTAGADQMLCVQNSGSSVTLTASVAGGTWTAMAGNAGTATIVTPNNATTVVNTFSTNGDYNFIYTTASGCKDTVKVTAYTPGTIGNYVWNDLNGNGQQDEAASNGINGVTVELYMETAPGSGVYNLSQTTTTANNGSGDAGYYNFSVCQSANYKIKFPTTNGAATLTQQNSNAGLDGNSDPNISTGFTQPFAINVLGSGVLKNNPTIDAGYHCSLPSPTCNSISICGAVDATTYVASTVSPVGGIINWNTGSATTATSYTYTVTNACGSVTCSNTITRLSTPSTPTCAPITICAGVDAYNPVMAAVTPAGGIIVWNTGNSSTATSYTYTVSNACGSASCTNTITRTAAPTTPTCSIITICSGVDATSAVMAVVTPAGGTITWNTGSATTATYYTYTVTNSCGSLNCSNQIVRTPTPSSITCNPVSVCTGVDATTSLMSAVNISGGSIAWNTGNATTATSYTYTITNACGSESCTNTITRIVTPATPTCAPVIICSNNDATVMVNAAVSPSGGNITWLPSGSNSTTATGYTYTVSNACGSASCTNTITRTTAGSIGNYVWADTNRNSLQDEPANLGINGAYVELYMDNGTGTYTLVATAHTANDGAGNPGYYNFPICTSGNYKVKFQTNYNGGNLTTQNPTPGVDGNSDADEITGYTLVIVIDINGTGTAKNNNTIDAGYKPTSVTTGGGGGVESKTLGDVIAVRLYDNAINSTTQVDGLTNGIKFSNSGAIVNGANDLTLSSLIPSTVANTNAAYVSTPTDLVNFTNAVEVLAVDYSQGSSTKAVAFGTKTLGDVYSHTKPICDRLKGAELLEVKNINVNGFNLMAYKVRQRTGETEYAVNLSAGTATNRSSISLQSNWFTDSYQHDEKLYNFQLWAVSYEMVKSMATDIVTKLQANGAVNTVTNADLPKAYISKGSRKGTDLVVTVNNNTTSTSGYFELHEKANENAAITTRQVPFTVNANGTNDIAIPVSDNYEGDIYVYINNKLTDLVYLADGTWNVDYNKSNTSISSFDVINESNLITNTDEHRLLRNVSVTGISKDYITIYKTMMGGGLEQNVTDYKSLMFNANAIGANKVQVTLIKKSISNWNDQYTYTMDLEGDKEYGVNLNQFKSSKYAQALYANDIVAVNFSFLTSRNTPTTMSINLNNARFTNTAIATPIEVKPVSVYPNPTSGKFSVNYTSDIVTPLVLKVIEVSTGRTIKTQFINAVKGSNKATIELNNNLTSGLYIVTLEGDELKYTPSRLMFNK